MNMDPIQMIKPFRTARDFLEANEENKFIFEGDFNTVLEPKLDKMRGNPNTHIKRRETIQTALEKLIWMIFWEC